MAITILDEWRKQDKGLPYMGKERKGKISETKKGRKEGYTSTFLSFTLTYEILDESPHESILYNLCLDKINHFVMPHRIIKCVDEIGPNRVTQLTLNWVIHRRSDIFSALSNIDACNRTHFSRSYSVA